MRYPDILDAIAIYRRNGNVARTLRAKRSRKTNGVPIIEVAYDLQAGTYVEAALARPQLYRDLAAEAASLLAPLLRRNDLILDIGSGEFTILSGIANECLSTDQRVLGCELSLSRISIGREYMARALRFDLKDAIFPFVGEFGRLPLADKSIDIVISSHAIEPNRGSERAILRELVRVARRALLLIEPCYENASEEIRARMDAHSYARGIGAAIKAAGASLHDPMPMRNSGNPLNPSFAFMANLDEPTSPRPDQYWSCPETGLPLEDRGSIFFSPGSLLAYPVIDSTPVLRRDAAILYSALAR